MKGFVATDFDGTLAGRDGKVSAVNLDTLSILGAEGFLRAIVTGRSLFSLLSVFTDIDQVEYIVFSSGAGIYDVLKGKIVREKGFSSRQVKTIAALLDGMGCDYMIHHPVPDSHRFASFRNASVENEDFFRRRDHYRGCDIHPENALFLETGASQFLVIASSGGDNHSIITRELPDYTVIRTASPVNPASSWIEIFPQGVDKGTAVEWIARKNRCPRERVFAIGNDYNDLHMLEWAGSVAVVENGPEELKALFPSAPSNEEDGFTHGVWNWIRGLYA